MTAPLTPEQERALREAATYVETRWGRGSSPVAVTAGDLLDLLAALDAEREKSTQLQVGSGNFEAAHVRAIRERDAARSELDHERAMRRIDLTALDKRDAEVVAARSDLAEARAEIERLTKAKDRIALSVIRAENAKEDDRSELSAVLSLRDLPTGAPALEHEGEAYAVALGFKNATDQHRTARAILEDGVEDWRARVAELEAEVAALKARR